MTYLSNRYFGLETALGKIAGYEALARFGLAPECDTDVPTDVWDGADGSVINQPIWVPPTEARIHNIVSLSVNDTVGGSGLRQVEVFGITDWNLPRQSEIVLLNGTTPVPTQKEYVVIDFMGGLRPNEGVITATAQVDATVTAAIQPVNGRSAMAVVSAPRGYKIALSNIYSTILKGPAAISGQANLYVKLEANRGDTDFVFGGADDFGNRDGVDKFLSPPQVYPGPCILKVQVTVDANNSECTAGFRGYLVSD